jgi:hypothetical protein
VEGLDGCDDGLPEEDGMLGGWGGWLLEDDD